MIKKWNHLILRQSEIIGITSVSHILSISIPSIRITDQVISIHKKLKFDSEFCYMTKQDTTHVITYNKSFLPSSNILFDKYLHTSTLTLSNDLIFKILLSNISILSLTVMIYFYRTCKTIYIFLNQHSTIAKLCSIYDVRFRLNTFSDFLIHCVAKYRPHQSCVTHKNLIKLSTLSNDNIMKENIKTIYGTIGSSMVLLDGNCTRRSLYKLEQTLINDSNYDLPKIQAFSDTERLSQFVLDAAQISEIMTVRLICCFDRLDLLALIPNLDSNCLVNSLYIHINAIKIIKHHIDVGMITKKDLRYLFTSESWRYHIGCPDHRLEMFEYLRSCMKQCRINDLARYLFSISDTDLLRHVLPHCDFKIKIITTCDEIPSAILNDKNIIIVKNPTYLIRELINSFKNKM